MKYLKFTGLLIFALVLLGACQGDSATPPSPTPTPAWQDFNSQEGGFTVQFPSAPASQVWTGDSEGFGQVYRGTFTSTYQNMQYRVYYMTVAGGLGQFGSPDHVLEMIRDEQSKTYKAKALNSKPLSLGNYPGLEYSLDAPDSKLLPGGGVVQSRVYIINDRIYGVEHLGPKKNSLSADIKKYLDSFRINGVGSLPTPAPVARSGVTAPEGWKEFVAQKDGFSVLLPGKPKRQVISSEKTLDTISYLAQSGLDGYGVLVLNLKDPALAKARQDPLFDVAKDSLFKGVKGTIVSEKPIRLGSYIGKELLIRLFKTYTQPTEGQMRARMYLANTRLYVVMAITLGEDAPPEVIPFLDSFKVLDSK